MWTAEAYPFHHNRGQHQGESLLSYEAVSEFDLELDGLQRKLWLSLFVAK
jgi:hypothetical protein